MSFHWFNECCFLIGLDKQTLTIFIEPITLSFRKGNMKHLLCSTCTSSDDNITVNVMFCRRNYHCFYKIVICNRDRGIAVSHRTAPHRPAAGRGGAEIFSGGAVAVHREIWRFPRLLAVLSVFQE